jgi:hypothetical protein
MTVTEKMDTGNRVSRILGLAFVLQFVTSVISGFALNSALIVPGGTIESMINIADKPNLMRLYIVVDMVTAMGIVFLGAMLFITLRKHGEKIALVALGLYILEAALLAVSRGEAFSLIHISQTSVLEGHPDYLQTMAALAIEAMDFVGLTLHVLVFGIGAILFYYLLDKSRLVPRALSLWGLITVIPVLIATLLAILGIEAPEWVIIPYVPFEFVIGLWILIKGIPVEDPT